MSAGVGNATSSEVMPANAYPWAEHLAAQSSTVMFGLGPDTRWSTARTTGTPGAGAPSKKQPSGDPEHVARTATALESKTNILCDEYLL